MAERIVTRVGMVPGTSLDRQIYAARNNLGSLSRALERAEEARARTEASQAAEVERLRLLVAEAESHLASLVASKEAPN